MIINHNLMSLNTLNSLNSTQTSLSKSMQKLSSGLKINSASDDAAGLAISEKMRGQINGLTQASANAQDGISMLQTAEGALNETTSILQRMRELAVQSSSDTNTDSDRSDIQSEFDQLTSEIDRISTTTQFNTKNLLDGSMGSAITTATKNVLSNSGIDAGAGVAATAGTALTALTDTAGNSLGIASGDTLTVSYVKDGALVTGSVTVTSGTTLSQLSNSDFSVSVATTGTNVGTISATATTGGSATAIYGLTITDTTSAASGGTTVTKATDALSNFTQSTAAKDARSDGSATILIGANTGQSMNISIDDMSASALGVEGLQVSTQAEANVAIKVIDTATQMVSSQRAQLGAEENRLEHTINNLSTSSENMTSAESTIRDTDMASEMANYSKLSVISQAATAMLAQANQQPQQVLTLLK
ncbi:MAG: flagellin [Negativicutes bacterium]|nr:flagellin [Negativicutes bacterium]